VLERILASDHTDTAGWLAPEGDQQGLRRYLDTLRERFWLIALTVLVTTLAAILYVAIADKSYQAESSILVTPVSRDDERFVGLNLIQDSPDPTRDVETAARLVTTVDVAEIVKSRLDSQRSPGSLLDDVSAVPVAQSNIVAITATGASARDAQQLADAFGEAVVADRTDNLHRRLDSLIANMRARLRQLEPDGNTLRVRIGQLEALRAGEDPTLRLEQRAELPSRASWPRPKLSIAAGILAGLVLGMGGALAIQMFDPRLRREEQLRAAYRLPVLARIPREPRSSQDGVIAPSALSPAGVEAYRSLRAMLPGPASQGEASGSRALLVSGSSPAEGKSTTALNLAASLALSGKRVILIEADLRRPAIGAALQLQTRQGIASVLLDGVPLTEALTTAPAYGENLRLLLADRGGQWMADRLSLPAAQRLVAEAKQAADYVVIDAPPLTAVVDALPLARVVDDVLVVTRLGRTDLRQLARLAELLAQQRIEPAGFVLIGVAPDGDHGYYGAAQAALDPDSTDHAEERQPAPASTV
jgi:succinoglycan biosynthesis transport protein ExoP